MQYGEIVELGEHRLMCGDSTDRNDVMKLIGNSKIDLVLTDPPYGIQVQSPNSGGKIGGNGRLYPRVIGDMNTGMFRDFWKINRTICSYYIIWGGQNFTDVLPPASGWIFWDKAKNSDKLTFGDGELAWSNISKRIKKYTYKMNGFIQEGDKELNKRFHPTQKPVELHMQLLEDFSKPGNIIFDGFGGSGTTLIAAELTGRRCLMMEVSPEYCDAIVDRYKRLMDSKKRDEEGQNEGQEAQQEQQEQSEELKAQQEGACENIESK